MENNSPRARKIIKISKKKIGITLIVMVIVAFVLYFYDANMRNNYFGDSGSEATIPQFSIDDAPSRGSSNSYSPDNEHYGDGQQDISDTREFLKTSYSGNIKTREVSEAVKMVKGAVREVEGRIDSENISEKNGYVRFVVPKEKFDAFRDEVEAITHKKLYVENISSENLLGQKQNIETRTESASTSISNLEAQKISQTTAYDQLRISLNKQLASVQTQVRNLQYQQSQTDSEDEYTALQTQISTLSQRESSLLKQLENEKAEHTSKINQLNTQITYYEKSLNGLAKEDTKFTNNIETVNGSVSVEWVSYWDMARIIWPVHPGIALVILGLALLYFLSYKGYIPKLEFF